MKNVFAILLAVGFASNAIASVKVHNGIVDLGHFAELKCSDGLKCSKVSGKAVVSTIGGVAAQSSASGDLSASQCGSTITSDGVAGSANGPVDLFNLPLISSSLLGCKFNFVVGVASTGNQQLQINPQTADQILLLTNAAGDAISADAIGESIVLEATQPGWVPVGKEQGTFTDIN